MDAFRIGGISRSLTALALGIGAAALIAGGAHLSWGLGAILVIPGILCCLPALSLVGGIRVVREGSCLQVRAGTLSRTIRVDLTACELEIIQTAAWSALIVHQEGRDAALGEWLTRKQCRRMLACCDQGAGPGGCRRRVPRTAPRDR